MAADGGKGDHTDETSIVVCNQGATGVTSAHGLSVGVTGAHVGTGNRAVGLLALAVADDLDIDALQPVGQVSVVHTTPSASDAPGVLVAVVLLVHAWQRDLVDQSVEVDMGSADQTNVSAALGRPVGVANEVVATDGLPVGTVPAPVGSVVDLHVVSGQAMGGSQDPVVGNDGTSTNGTTVASIGTDEQAHNVGSLALGSWVAVDNATLGSLGQEAGAVQTGRGGGHQGQSRGES